MKYRAEIDGLRALAVLPVILFHAGFELFGGGFVGVDVFFVISGYLITSIIISEMGRDNFSLINFYERRARRILPALFFVMLVSIPFAWFWLTPGDLKDFGQSLIAVATFSSNILFWIESGYFATASELKPLLHTWSLAVEEQYYILFPLFLMIFWNLPKKYLLLLLALIFLLSLSLAQWFAFSRPSANFYLLPTRGWELLIGVFLAFYLQKNQYIKSPLINQTLSLLGFAMIVYSIAIYDKNTPFPSLYALVPTIGTALLILTAVPQTLIHKILSARIIVGIGLISYSAYLWHQPILAFARHRLLGEISEIVLLLLCLSSLIMAYISWRWVEKPFRDKQTISRKTVFSFSLAGILFFCLIGSMINQADGFNTRFSKEFIELEKLKADSVLSTSQCNDAKNDNLDIELILKNCKFGDPENEPIFAIFGDSHARALVPGLSLVSKELKISGLNLASTACFPTLGDGAYIPKDKNQERCLKMRKLIINLIENKKLPKNLYLAARWPLTYQGSRFDNMEGGIEPGKGVIYQNTYTNDYGTIEGITKELDETINILQQAGINITIIYPIPEVGWDPLKRLLLKYIYNPEKKIDALHASTSFEVFKERNKSTLNALNKLVYKNNILKYEPHILFCNLQESIGRCITQKNQILLYYDDDHVSIEGAKLIAKELLE